MPERATPPSPHPDLSRFSETTRRQLYDHIVRSVFQPPADDPEEDPGDLFDPVDPDAVGLSVFYLFGRWFATWVNLSEPPDGPEADRQTVIRFDLSSTEPEEIVLYEL